MRTRILLASLLPLVGALGCTKDPDNSQPNSQPKSAPKSIQRAEHPGMIAISGSLEKAAFQNLSTVYLLAASKGDPLAAKYEPLAEKEGQGLPEDMQQAFQTLIKYVRAGGEGTAEITASIDVLKKHPVGTILAEEQAYRSCSSTVPGTVRYGASRKKFSKLAYPAFIFIYEVYDQDKTGPQLSLQELFAARNIDPTSADSVPRPIETLVAFKEPPQNIVLELEHMMRDKDVTVSPTLTLPAKCTAQGQDTVYKLTGVFRQPDEYYKKGGGYSSRDKLEGLTYFRWGNQWYKITDSAPKPATTTAQEAQEVAEKSGYESNAFRYLYTRDDAA